MFSPKTTWQRLVVSLAAIFVLKSSSVAAEPLRYNRDIRPLLSDKCFFCHGPDPNHREADLRLDVEEAAHDWVIEAGKAEESELWRRITSDDPEEQMPPPDSGKTLSAEQIRTLRRWIDEGAKYEDHWSFVSPTRPEVPMPEGDDWVRNPIDAFILARLEAEGLAPSPEADKATLIRRLTLDLTGLPPTPEEVDAFTAIRLLRLMRNWSIGCCNPNVTANGWLKSGSMRRGTPTRWATRLIGSVINGVGGLG